MAVDDTVADGEPESGPFFLGREEGVEYILDVLLFDPLAAILERDDQLTGMGIDGSSLFYTYY